MPSTTIKSGVLLAIPALIVALVWAASAFYQGFYIKTFERTYTRVLYEAGLISLECYLPGSIRPSNVPGFSVSRRMSAEEVNAIFSGLGHESSYEDPSLSDVLFVPPQLWLNSRRDGGSITIPFWTIFLVSLTPLLLAAKRIKRESADSLTQKNRAPLSERPV